MFFDLKKIMNNPGERLPVDFSMAMSDVDFGGMYPVSEPVSVVGQVKNVAGMLLLQLKVSTCLNAVCDRCGTPFRRDMAFSIETMLSEELQDEDNDEILLLEGEGIDLEEVVRTEFILHMDTKMLCREDCKGLCYRCGANLNDGPCQCKKETDPRLAALAKLLNKEE